MGKGSTRRPQQIPDKEFADNWARIFGQPKRNQNNGNNENQRKGTDKAAK